MLSSVLVLPEVWAPPAETLALFLQSLQSSLERPSSAEVVYLASDLRKPEHLRERMLMAVAFVFATGTYWDSWGSPMQRFLEQSTDLEANETCIDFLVEAFGAGRHAVTTAQRGIDPAGEQMR